MEDKEEKEMTDSKLGIHVCNWSYEAEKHAECQPTVLKSIEHNAEKLAKFKAASPETLTVGRVVLDGWDGRADFANPKFAADTVAGIILANIKGCRYDVLEGTNEPIINSEEDAKRLCEFNIHLAQRIQAEGFDFAAYSFRAAGNEIDYVRRLEPALKEADYLAMHAYGPGPLFHESYWYLNAYQRFWVALSEQTRQDLKGLLLTEYGIAKGLLWTKDDKKSDVGWLDPRGPQIEPRHYGGDLIISDTKFPPYVKGAMIFQTGDLFGKWRTFEIKQLLPGLEAHIRSFVYPRVNTPEIPNREEPKMEPLPEGQIYALDVSAWGGSIKDEQWRAAHDAGFRLAVVQAWGALPGNRRGKNPYCTEQLVGARKAGMMTAIYFHLPSDVTTETHLFIPVVKEAAGSEYAHTKFVAVDIEGEKLLHPTEPKARLADAISHIKDKPVIIYTSRYMWQKVMAMAVGFEKYPLWDARYDEKPELDTNWLAYGGWKERAIKQYRGTTTVAGGISADLNVADLGRLFPEPKIDYVEEALKEIEAAQSLTRAADQRLDKAKENLKQRG